MRAKPGAKPRAYSSVKKTGASHGKRLQPKAWTTNFGSGRTAIFVLRNLVRQKIWLSALFPFHTPLANDHIDAISAVVVVSVRIVVHGRSTPARILWIKAIAVEDEVNIRWPINVPF